MSWSALVLSLLLGELASRRSRQRASSAASAAAAACSSRSTQPLSRSASRSRSAAYLRKSSSCTLICASRASAELLAAAWAWTSSSSELRRLDLARSLESSSSDAPKRMASPSASASALFREASPASINSARCPSSTLCLRNSSSSRCRSSNARCCRSGRCCVCGAGGAGGPGWGSSSGRTTGADICGTTEGFPGPGGPGAATTWGVPIRPAPRCICAGLPSGVSFPSPVPPGVASPCNTVGEEPGGGPLP
mmetsp:Transcript_58957/g.157967  ORF Transcript_58957/g.157967 Transcript_58957/m.157967 type:complete len:251 (-) Transcript_58957:222-974(-)